MVFHLSADQDRIFHDRLIARNPGYFLLLDHIFFCFTNLRTLSFEIYNVTTLSLCTYYANKPMQKSFLLTALAFAFNLSQAQQSNDTSKLYPSLPDIIVKAFEQNKSSMNVPASVNVVNRHTLGLFGPTSIVQAVNTTPGIRMEERSPGSYRLNIRGSSLRSPFGVRNVKLYFNDIPITDPGGQTYLNELGYYNINSIEIIKGPASSLYGAGTGGAM